MLQVPALTHRRPPRVQPKPQFLGVVLFNKPRLEQREPEPDRRPLAPWLLELPAQVERVLQPALQRHPARILDLHANLHPVPRLHLERATLPLNLRQHEREQAEGYAVLRAKEWNQEEDWGEGEAVYGHREQEGRVGGAVQVCRGCVRAQEGVSRV